MPKRFLVLWGPPAVGKMTVGQALEARTGLKLFHNHMTIEPFLPFFDFDDPAFQRLSLLFRQRLCEEVAASDLPGMTFTFVWGMENPEDKAYIDGLADIFRDQGAEIYYAELRSSLATRLARNGTENRLRHKPSKRDLVFSKANLLEMSEKFVLNSSETHPFFYQENTVVVDNDALSPEDAAAAIIDAFGW